jgi:hypothetical protein
MMGTSDVGFSALLKTYHALHYYGLWSLSDIDDMTPFERDIYIHLWTRAKEKEAQQAEAEAAKVRGGHK